MTRMMVVQRMLLTSFAVLLAAWSARAAAAAPAAPTDTVAHGRVSSADQSGLVKGKDDADWSYASVNSLVMPGDSVWADEKSALEIEFPNGVLLRMADGSKLDVMEVPPSALFRGTTGSFYIQRTRRSEGDVTLDTPAGAVSVAADSQIRVDILEGGASTVTVRWGKATVHAEGGEPVEFHAGERGFIDPGYLPSKPVDFDRSQEDAFDTWNRSRARDLAEGSAPTPIQSSYAGGQAPVGMSELSGRGEWVTVDNEPMWHPTVAEYVPYRYGYWSYVPVEGYVWVDYYPWAYVTTHYGHWRYHSRYGWCWSYYGAYRPAYAYTLHYGDSFIWAPMDVYGYPCRYGSYAGFSIGNIGFSYAFSSCAYDYEVFGGFHSVFALEFTWVFDSHHRRLHNDCDYWRLDSGSGPHRGGAGGGAGGGTGGGTGTGGGGRPHVPSGGTERVFAPSRVYRGATMASDGATRAIDRVRRLEASRPVTLASATAKAPAGTATPTTRIQSLRTARAVNAQPTAPGAHRMTTREVEIARPAETRVASVPGQTRPGAALPPVRTISNTQPRDAGRSANAADRARVAGPVRTQQPDSNAAIDRARPQVIRPSQPGNAPASGATQNFPAERPRVQTTRPGEGGNAQAIAQGPHVITRPGVTESPRPQVIRPSVPDRQYEAPVRQQYTRPEAPQRSYDRAVPQQMPRPEIPRQQMVRPEPQAPQYVRPEPQYSRPESHYSAPAPQPRQEYRAPAPAAPTPQPRVEYRQPEPSGGRGDNGGSDRSFGRPR